MAKSDYSEEELALLTPEEQAALDDQDFDEDGVGDGEDDPQQQEKAPGAKEGEDDANLDDNNPGDGTQPSDDGKSDADAAAQAAAEKAAADALAAQQAADAQADAPTEQTQQAVTTYANENFNAEPLSIDTELADIDARDDKLSEQFDAGEITAQELRKQQRDLDRERRQLENSAQEENDWRTAQRVFFSTPRSVNLSNAAHMGAFDAILRQQTAKSKEQGLKVGIKDLELAEQEFNKQFGIQVAAPSVKTEAKQDTKTPAAPKKPDPIPNIGKAPAASTVDVEDGEFAHLDRLADSGDTEKYEAAIAHLEKTNPSAYEKYLAR